MASSNEGYWSRSWALLTRDSGWFKPVLVLAAARLVPIVGSFGADGYALEWGRLTSWGVDSSPKQKGVDIPACICTGARAFVVSLGYGLAIALVQGILSRLLGGFGGLLGTLIAFAGIAVILVAQLRSAIYQTIGSGYQVNRIADMVKRDPNGLARVTGLMLAMGTIVGLIASILIGFVVMTSMGGLIMEAARADRYGYDEVEMASATLQAIGAAMPAFCVMGYLLNIASTIVNLISTTAVGLWMRQFDVRAWGESSDPLPGDPSGAAAGYAATGAGAPYGEPAPGAGAPYGGTAPSAGASYGGTTPGAGAGYAPTSDASSYVPPQPNDPTTTAHATAPVAPAPTAPSYESKAEPTWEGTKAAETVEPQEPAVDEALVSDIPVVPLDGYSAEGAAAETEDATAEKAEAASDEEQGEDVPDTFFLRDFDEKKTGEEEDVPTFSLDEVYGEDAEVEAEVEAKPADEAKAAVETEVATAAEAAAEPEAEVEPATEPTVAAEPEAAAVQTPEVELVSTSELEPEVEPAAEPKPEPTEDEILAEMEKAIRESMVQDDKDKTDE